MSNKCVKFHVKTPNVGKKMAKKLLGIFFLRHTVGNVCIQLREVLYVRSNHRTDRQVGAA